MPIFFGHSHRDVRVPKFSDHLSEDFRHFTEFNRDDLGAHSPLQPSLSPPPLQRGNVRSWADDGAANAWDSTDSRLRMDENDHIQQKQKKTPSSCETTWDLFF